jgi:hypothetical protein
MIFMLDLMILVLILRASVRAGYYPVFWGAVYGLLNFILGLAPDGDLLGATIAGALSGLLCGFLLFVLSIVDGRPIIWWVVLLSTFIIPFVASAMN